MAEKEIKQWITINGQHVPIFEGESKQDAVNRAIAKNNEDVKEKQIAKNKEQADKLNGKSANDPVGDTVKALKGNKAFNNLVKRIDNDHYISAENRLKSITSMNQMHVNERIEELAQATWGKATKENIALLKKAIIAKAEENREKKHISERYDAKGELLPQYQTETERATRLRGYYERH